MYRANIYENDVLLVEQIEPIKAIESISTLLPQVRDNNTALKVYSNEDLIKKISNDDLREIYLSLKEYIEGLSGIQADVNKLYLVFRKENKPLISMEPNSGCLYLFFNEKFSKMKKLDKEKIGENMSGKGHHATGDYKIKITNDNNLGYIKDLIKKFYESH